FGRDKSSFAAPDPWTVKGHARTTKPSRRWPRGLHSLESSFTGNAPVRFDLRNAAARSSRYLSMVDSHHQFGEVGWSPVLPSGGGNSLSRILRLMCWRLHEMPLLGRSRRSSILKVRGIDVLRHATKHTPTPECGRVPSYDGNYVRQVRYG